MKIVDVRAAQPIAANSPPDWRTSLGQFLVAVDADDGVTGYGVGGGGAAGVHVVRTVLRDLLLGRDPREISSLWDAMYAATLPFGRKGLAIMALSGVDLALWDLRGRSEGVPVAALLGGRTGVPIPTYVTVWDDVPASVAAGTQAVKLHASGEPRGPQGERLGHAHGTVSERIERIVAAVARARAAIGPDRELMLDAWMQWDVPFTLAIAERIAPLDVSWIEEPLPADDFAGYAELARSCPVPIAGGEHEFTARGFDELIAGRLHQVLQPDVCWCGGLTELVKIYAAAKRAGLRVCPHRGAEVWGLHAIAALDPQPLAESGRPWMTWVGGQPEIVDGEIMLGDAPGFGVEIDEANCFGQCEIDRQVQ